MDLSTIEGPEAESTFPYWIIVSIVLYTATHTRPNIAVVTSIFGIHVEKPSFKPESAAIKVSKYSSLTGNPALSLRPNSSQQLWARVDANWTGEPDPGKSSHTGVVE